MAKSVSGDSVGGEGNAHAKTNREINKATLRLDWILGDDPSQIVIPGSPPGVDTPPFFTAGDPAETAHVVLETIEEREEAAPALDIQRISSVGTWPRMRQPTNNRPPITADLAISVESVIDSGVYKCGSSETVLSSVTTESALPKISEQAMTNLDKGTQTDFNVVQVHATVQEGRIRNDYICTTMHTYDFTARTSAGLLCVEYFHAASLQPSVVFHSRCYFMLPRNGREAPAKCTT